MDLGLAVGDGLADFVAGEMPPVVAAVVEFLGFLPEAGGVFLHEAV